MSLVKMKRVVEKMEDENEVMLCQWLTSRAYLGRHKIFVTSTLRIRLIHTGLHFGI